MTHGSAIYVFDAAGAARLLVIPSLGSTAGDVAGITADLRRLVEDGNSPGLLARLMQFI